MMRLLLIGDIVGKPGRQIVVRALAGLRQQHELDLVVANAENAAGGSGITPAIYRELIAAGIDVVTLGDHVYRKREVIGVFEKSERIVRPANLSAAAVGRLGIGTLNFAFGSSFETSSPLLTASAMAAGSCFGSRHVTGYFRRSSMAGASRGRRPLLLMAMVGAAAFMCSRRTSLSAQARRRHLPSYKEPDSGLMPDGPSNFIRRFAC